MQGKSNSFLQVTPFIPRSGLLASSYIAFPVDTIVPRGCLFVSPLENFVATGAEEEDVAPPAMLETGEGSFDRVNNGGNFNMSESSYSTWPYVYWQVYNTVDELADPPFFPDGGALTISNLQVTCPEHPFYVPEITVPGPQALDGAPCRANVTCTGEPPIGAVITISYDWVCGEASGTFTFTMTVVP
jgi:hypothetical protein